MYNTNEIVTEILMHEKLYMERKNVHVILLLVLGHNS